MRMRPQISQMGQPTGWRKRSYCLTLDMTERDPDTYAIIGAAMEVHAELGHGFLENVYHDALCHELAARGVPHQREVAIPVLYKGRPLTSMYRADLVCFGSVIVELKAIQRITGIEMAQLINYLKATGISRGLLLNFGSRSLQYERMVRDHEDGTMGGPSDRR